MRLYNAKVPAIAEEIVRTLSDHGAIESDSLQEVQLDVESVLSQYVRDEQDITEKAKDLVASRHLSQNELGRMRRLVAEQRKIKLGEEAIDYLLDQIIEMLMHSANVEEIFAEDFELRRLMREPLRRQQIEEQRLQAEVRGQLKHVQEGSSLWEVEYRRMMEETKRRKGL
jgi:hypothetical protein